MQKQQIKVVYRSRDMIIMKSVEERGSKQTRRPLTNSTRRLLPIPSAQSVKPSAPKILYTVPMGMIGNATQVLMQVENVQRDSVRQITDQKASLTNSRGQRPAGAVNYVALQRAAQTAAPMLGINKRTFRPTPTAFGTDVLPCFLCIGAAEVGDIFEDPVDVFYKPWEGRVAALIANNSKIDLEEAERLLNKEVGQFSSDMWMEIDRINRCRHFPMIARSAAMFWMRMFYEALDAIVVQASNN